ncbi:MAG: ATP-binding protein [Steroidobacteraceae bacterium]
MSAPERPGPSTRDATNRKNMLLLIQLRWIAATGQIATIVFVHFGLQIPLPLEGMAAVLTTLVSLNLVSLAWLHRRTQISNRALRVALLFDVAALTAQLYLSGGASNPFTALYLLQIGLAAVLLDARSSWATAAAACISFVGIALVNRPLPLPAGMTMNLYLVGTFVCLTLNAGLLVFFVTRIARNLRERDARLAALKQQAAEEKHIVRMGLLASGAAHELGTPLASVSVILGDWQHMPAIRRNPEMAQDVAEMQAAVERCKSILSGVLLSAGEARSEAPVVTTVNGFLSEIVTEWRTARPGSTLRFDGSSGSDIVIVSDSTLKQVVTNLLDNAFDVSPQDIRLSARHDDETLLLQVTDAGPGFAPEMLERLGKPYNSTKAREGAGLGLFIAMNIVRKLGGSIAASNRPEGGAVVSVELPLAGLRLEDRAHA